MTDEIQAAASVLDPAGAGSLPKPSPDAVAKLGAGDPMGGPAPQPLSDARNPNNPSVHDRARALVDGYAHALETNSPRTVAELAELKALLDLA